jgi:hypothetical protein
LTYQGENRRAGHEQEMLAVATEGGKVGAKSVLTTLGVDVDNPLDMQADFQHLRNNRLGSEQFGKTVKRTLIMAFIGGAITVLGVGFKQTIVDLFHLGSK